MSKQQVAVKEDKLPDFMSGMAGMGTENLGVGDVETPRVKLMQALSPELTEYNDLKAGQFWHSLTEHNFGNTVRICPIFVDKRFILWRPRKSGGGILARADDGIHWSPAGAEFSVKLDNGAEVKWRTAKTVMASGLDQWGSSNPADAGSPPAATRMYSIVCSFPDFPDMFPAVVTLQRAAIKVGNKFIGKLKIGQTPSFGRIFVMSSIEDRNAAGERFYNYSFRMDGVVQDKALFESNFKQYQFFKTQGVKVSDKDQEDEIATEEAF